MDKINQAKQQFLHKNDYQNFSLKAILFDMDGVLYDSMPNHARSWSIVMQSHGFNMTEEEAYLHEGRTGDNTINIISKREGKNLSEEMRKSIYREKVVAFGSCPKVLPMKGSSELLRKVAANGLSVLLVTGSGQPSLLDSLNKNFPGTFVRERMVTAFDVKKGKPNPEPYLLALQKGDLKPDEVVVIENAPLGIESAKAAGLFVIAVNTGPLPDIVLLEAGADILYPSVEVLCEKWEQLFHCLTFIAI
jgi:HAD superfamily hydrolase (TIGR01509 family)